MSKERERIPVEKALERLAFLLASWGLTKKDFILVDEFAYILQGYNVQSTEVEFGHLDVYVRPEKLPWKTSSERSVVPPKESSQMQQWVNFMQETGYSLDMLKGHPEIFKVPTVDYLLPNGKTIRLMRAYEMTEQFVDKTLMHYSLEDVGEEKIKEWLNKLELIRKVSINKGDEELATLCATKIETARHKWSSLLH